MGLPFVALSRPPDGVTPWRELFEESLRVAAPDAGTIPVERINGPVLFVTGTADAVWPCAETADRAIERLRRHNFSFPLEHARFEDAGHAILVPPYRVGPISNPWPSSSYAAPQWLTAQVPQMGGTPEGNRRARIDAWPKMIAFLNANF